MGTSYSDFKLALAARESGGNGDYKAENSIHYIGRYQFGESVLNDIGYYTEAGDQTQVYKVNNWVGNWTALSGVKSKDEFLGINIYNTDAGHKKAIAAQEAAFDAEIKLNKSRILAGDDGWWVYDGQILNGYKVTLSGMLAYAHIGGYTALTKNYCSYKEFFNLRWNIQ